MDLEIAFLDGRIRPHPRHQLALADQFAGMLDEHDEDLQDFLPCVDVYGPRPIATGFDTFRIGGHNC
jgi:hypothetical protein